MFDLNMNALSVNEHKRRSEKVIYYVLEDYTKGPVKCFEYGKIYELPVITKEIKIDGEGNHILDIREDLVVPINNSKNKVEVTKRIYRYILWFNEPNIWVKTLAFEGETEIINCESKDTF